MTLGLHMSKIINKLLGLYADMLRDDLRNLPY